MARERLDNHKREPFICDTTEKSLV